MSGSAEPRAAAEYLAALCGIEPEHFSFRGAVPDPARHGLRPMLNRCRFVSLDRPDTTAGFTRADLAAYRGRNWTGHLRDLHAAYLAGKPRAFHSPVHHTAVPVLGEVVNEAQQIYVALHGGELFFVLFVGRMIQGTYYPARDLFVVPRATALDLRKMLWMLLGLFLSQPMRFARFVMSAREGKLRPGFVIGDMRPGHFIKESLAYLDAAQNELRAFADRGGAFAAIADWCAMDPVTVFPELGRHDVMRLGSAGVSLALLDAGLDAHRVYRFKTHEGGAWLRRRFHALGHMPPAAAADRCFRVMISLDAERQRIVNQTEAFRFVLRRLGAASARLGLALHVVWDGWTVPHEPSDRDRMVMARIEEAIAAITDDLGVAIGDQHRIFGRSAFAKVADIAACDLALVTQGTGAVLPSWLLERPTITYHVAAMVPNRSDLCEANTFQVDQRAVIEAAADGAATHGSRFALALWGLDDALVRAVGARLGLVRELADQATTNAGTA